MEPADRLRVFGTDEPCPVIKEFAVGPLTFELENGSVRYLRWRGVEILRGISYLLRDRDWGTPAVELGPITVVDDPLDVTFTGKVSMGRAHYHLTARIEAGPDGRFVYTVSGAPDIEIETNRCGFVVLHPAAFTGSAVEVIHTDGTAEQSRFPETISAGQPFFNIRSLRYEPAEGIKVHCTMEAELPHDPAGRFEMEDQRNWSDASYKTYVGSLLDQWPYRLEAGVTRHQRVEVRVTGGRESNLQVQEKKTRKMRLVAPTLTSTRLPPVGLGVAPGLSELDEARIESLAGLHPAYLTATLDVEDPQASRELATIASLRSQTDAEIQLEIIVPGRGSPEAEVSLGVRLCAEASLVPSAVLVCPRPLLKSIQPTGQWPELPPLEQYLVAARAAFPQARIGGGMPTYFTELNRCRPAATEINFVTHATVPIVHAPDDRSVIETLETLPHIARSVRALWPNIPYRVGPSTLALRSNPYGATPFPNPKRHRVALAESDPRQSGLFAAAWTVGYASALAEFDLETLTLHFTHGPLGVLASAARDEVWRTLHPNATVWPVFHVLRALARARGARRVTFDAMQKSVSVLAWSGDNGQCILIANLGSEPAEIEFDRPSRVNVLDVDSFGAAVSDTMWLDRPTSPQTSVILGAYSTAFVVEHIC
jgi:hypothetical protein